MTELEKNYLEIVRLMYSFSDDATDFTGPVSLSCIDIFISKFYKCVDFELVSKLSGKNITTKGHTTSSGGDLGDVHEKSIDPYDLSDTIPD
jgi:hypothetical protein